MTPRHSRTRLLFLGEDQKTRAVEEVLHPLPLRVVRHVSSEGVQQTLLDQVAAVVLVPPLRGAPCERVVGSFVAARADVPVFLVVPEDEPDARVVRLYRRGASAVFAWPLESRLFPAVLQELLGIDAPRVRRTDADRALERAIRARLRVLGRAEKQLRISARNGVARLTGRVDRLWELRALEANVACVPGVLATDVRHLEVKPSSVSDRDIARAIRRLLKGVSSIEDRTLSVSVHDGHAVLMGTIVNREEWLHALELLAMLEGVRSVTNKTTEAPRRKRTDRALAKRLAEKLSVLVQGSDEIRVAVLAGVAVLRGRAPVLSAKREAEAVVSRESSVTRVVNKVEVVPGDQREPDPAA